MKALVLEQYKEPLALEDVDVPEVGPDEALVEIEACGVCRSDWHGWQGDLAWMDVQPPLGQILGHEPAGHIVEVGDQVTNFEKGDRVVLPFNAGDGTCYECRTGHSNICENLLTVGFSPELQGAFAEYTRMPNADTNLVKLPEGVSMAEMAGVGCRFMTSFHGLAHRADLEAGDWLAVHGCGGIGLSAIQIGTALGANVIAVDIMDEKLETAREVGAVETVNAETHDAPERIHEITGGGANVSVDALGRAETCRNSILSLRRRGQHIQIGITTQEEEGMVAVPTDIMVGMEIDFRGSLGMQPARYNEIFNLMESGKLDPGRLVTETIALDDVNETLERMTDYQVTGMNVITDF